MIDKGVTKGSSYGLFLFSFTTKDQGACVDQTHVTLFSTEKNKTKTKTKQMKKKKLAQ